MVRINSKGTINDMKNNFFLKYILIIFTVVLFNFFNTSSAQNIDKFYGKIDLFSEVLEKIREEYVDEVDQAEIMDFSRQL